MSTLSISAPAVYPPREADPPATGIEVAVVIPAFNEEAGVGATVEQVRAALSTEGYTYEIVVIDDGSTDRTAVRAEAAGARVLRLPGNGGYGAALKAGIATTAAEYIVIIDADGSYPPETIPLLLAKASRADMVVGARAANSVNIPLIRRPAKWFLTRLASYLAGRPIPDLNSGLRVMRRSVLERFLAILPSGFSFTTTITLAMLSTNYRVVYEPIEYRRRVGSSKIRPIDFINFVILVLRTVVLFNPLKVFLPLGGMLFAGGVAKFVYDLFLWNLSESAVMAFLAAVMVWSLGLLADMVARLQLCQPGAR
jgi:glycosyltransferase involved in cell wall biosynthesis